MELRLKDGQVIDIRNIITKFNTSIGLRLFCYRIYGLDNSFFGENQHKHWCINEKYIILANVINFTFTEKVKVDIRKGFQLENPKRTVAEEGIYLFLAYPCESHDTVINNEELCAILAISLGRNIIHNYIFDSFTYIKGNGMITTSPLNIEKYKIVVRPKDLNIDLLKLIDSKLLELDIKNKSRIEMSLRWYYKALFENEYVDGFLSYWIALETLAKEEGSDIKVIIEKLNEVYGREVMYTNNNFQVNLLFGIRSAIVHNGKNKKLTSGLLDYLAAIYVDVLLRILNIKSEQRLLKLKKSNNIDIQSFSVKQNWKELDHLS